MAPELLECTKVLLVCSWLRVPPLERRYDACQGGVRISRRTGSTAAARLARRACTAPHRALLRSIEACISVRANVAAREAATRSFGWPRGLVGAFIVTGGHPSKLDDSVVAPSSDIAAPMGSSEDPSFCFRDPAPRRPTVPSRRDGRAPCCKTWKKVRPTTLRRLARGSHIWRPPTNARLSFF
jgi:hypothetical protein